MDIYIYDLELTITALVAENTPCLISLGKLCMDNGYEYVWNSYSDKPYLQKPGGKKVYCEVQQRCPSITVTKAPHPSNTPEDIPGENSEALPDEEKEADKAPANGEVENQSRYLLKDIMEGDLQRNII